MSEAHSRTEKHPRGRPLHEVVQEVFVSVLLDGHLHLILCEHVVVHVVLLPFEPLSLFSQLGLFLLLFVAIVVSIKLHVHTIRIAICFLRKISTYLLLLRNALDLPQLPLPILLLLPQIRVLLNLGLVQAVDNSVLTRAHVNPPNLLVVLEAHLTRRHGAILLQVRPGRVDDSDIVLLVALDRVGFGELRAVREQLFGDRIPGLVVAHAQVDMGGTEVVDVEPDIFWPAVGDQVLISLKKLAWTVLSRVIETGVALSTLSLPT